LNLMCAPQVWVTSELAAYWLRSTYGVQITAATIRQWARRGYLHHRYELHEVEAVARERGVIPGPS
jgi:hypothetical protein